MLDRLATLVVKELLLALREPQTRALLIMPVILQLLLFPFAASLEVKNARLAIQNDDFGGAATELIERLARTQAFPGIRLVHGQSEMRTLIDSQQALLGLEFPAGFSRDVAAGRPATVLAIVDGRRSNSAQIAFGYASGVIADFAAEKAAAAGRPVTSKIVVRNWFNANLEYRWFMLPVLVAIITTLGSLIVTALSIAREREHGTFDQLLVSPLTAGYIMVGKTVPAMVIALSQGTIVAAAAVFFYRVPFHGSIVLLYLCMLCYGLSLAGIGLFISSLCQTQQQAFLGVFTFMVPAVMLSGFVAPVENMPLFFRAISWCDPLTHFIVIVKGLFLKGYGITLAWPNLWPLLVNAGATMSLGYWMYRRRVA